MENENENTPTMDTDTAIQALKDYMARTGKNQTEAALELGVSGGCVSAFLANKYKTPQAIIPKIEQLLELSVRREASPKEPGFRMTSVSRQVFDVIAYCHLQGKIGVAYGDAGVGKTMACKEYLRQYPDTVMMTISPCFASITGVNELLADALHIKEAASRRIFAEAIRKLRGSNRVIVIDEAQHLTCRVINHLRSIGDASGVGIAFVGNEEIYTKMRGSGKEAYAQLFSRIGRPAHVLTNDIKLEDVKLVFEEARLEDNTLKILHGISKTNYGLRGAVNVYVNAIIGYQVRDYAELSAARIAAMAREMKIS